MQTNSHYFGRMAAAVSRATGTASAFTVAILSVVVWAVVGPRFHYSDTWQLTINTGTTIVTFLMVFLIQYTQNRDAHVMHLKLDELIRAGVHARNELVDMEHLPDSELERLQKQFEALREKAASTRERRSRVRR